MGPIDILVIITPVVYGFSESAVWIVATVVDWVNRMGEWVSGWVRY